MNNNLKEDWLSCSSKWHRILLLPLLCQEGKVRKEEDIWPFYWGHRSDSWQGFDASQFPKSVSTQNLMLTVTQGGRWRPLALCRAHALNHWALLPPMGICSSSWLSTFCPWACFYDALGACLALASAAQKCKRVEAPAATLTGMSWNIYFLFRLSSKQLWETPHYSGDPADLSLRCPRLGPQ